jgi:hypothetical protein
MKGRVHEVCTGSGWYDDRPRASEYGKARFAGSLAVRALLAQLVEHFHGKEGVAGSSPAEGSLEGPGNGAFFFAPVSGRWRIAATWAAFGPHTNR